MTSVVYAVRAGEHVKIGFTADLSSRLKSLQAGTPHRLELLGTHPGGRAREAAWHREFASSRAHGEWFQLTPEQMDTLALRLEGQPRILRLPQQKQRPRSWSKRRSGRRG